MNDIQFEVITDLAVMNPQHIETNFEAVDAYLTEAMEPYTQLVVTEDSIGDAKKTLASLRKLKDGINAQKIAVKREWMKPYTEYEDKAKQLMARVEAGISNIDGQVKDYDARRKEQKMAELKEYFERACVERRIGAFLTWDSIKNPKWANLGYSQDDAEKEIDQAIDTVEQDIACITERIGPFLASMLDEYSRSHNLREALAVEKRLQALQEAEERKKAEAVAETFKEQENESDGSTASFEPVYEPQQTFIRRSDEEEPPKPKLYTVDFRVVMTMQQANALRAFFVEQGIQYYKI
jgi:hypothetical protein